MKKLMQVDLSALATPVEPAKKRTYKKRKVEEVEERPTTGGKSIESFKVKEKKPPTEKQLAAREKMRLARLEKVEKIKAEKEKLDEEIRLKQQEVERKKAELAEKRRLKREEKKKEKEEAAKKVEEEKKEEEEEIKPLKPVVQSMPAETGTVEDKGPTIDQVLKSIQKKQEIVAEEEDLDEQHEHPMTPVKTSSTSTDPPPAPKRTLEQRTRKFPFGKPVPFKQRLR